MPENEFRYGDVEFRQDDDGLGVVVGTVIRYGDVAKLPWGTEEFKAGAFENVESEDLIANRMHQRTQPIARTGAGLVVVDGPEELRAEVTLPDTTFGRDTATELSLRILRGLSLEFRAIEDTVNEDTEHRVISKAEMFGFGVVDRPAYPGSVASMRAWGEYRTAHGLRVPGASTGHEFISSKGAPRDMRLREAR